MVWYGIYTYMTPFGCIWGVFNIRTPGSCTILAGETSWDGVDCRGGTKGLFPTSTPHPLSQAGARVTVPRLRSGKFDCSWHSAMPLVLHFALSRFHSTRFVFVASCGRCLSSGALGLLLARWCLSFFVLEVLPPLFCLSSCWRLRLIFVL